MLISSQMGRQMEVSAVRLAFYFPFKRKNDIMGASVKDTIAQKAAMCVTLRF